MPASCCSSTMRAPPSPTTAWCRRRAFADYRKWVGMHMEVLNHAIEGLPPERIRYHVCWGSWPGPHTTDVPLKDIVDLILQGEGRRLCDRRRQSAPRARMEGVEGREAARRARCSIPGVISHATNVVEHPELVAERIVRLRQAGRPRERASPAPIAASRRGRSTGASIPRSCGRSSRRWRKARASPARNCGADARRDCQRGGFDRTRSMLKRPGPVRNRSRAPPRIARFLRKLVY